MQLPDALKRALEQEIEAFNPNLLRAANAALSTDYRSGRDSSRGFKDRAQLIAYLAARMPATFGACVAVFHEIRERLSAFSPHSFLDLGAGPGTASWAALEVFPEIADLHLIEKEASAIEIGKKLSAAPWKWQQASLEEAEIPAADFAVLSYSYGELKEPFALIEKLKNIPIVAIIEPGTPKGFERIRALRERVIASGAKIIAPCPHAARCPMPSNDWCHFSARIERTRLHRHLKEGTLGYEDEKYSYVVYSSQFSPSPFRGRVVRPPKKGSGHVRLSLCANTGNIIEEVVTRSNREQYREARDAVWGTAIL